MRGARCCPSRLQTSYRSLCLSNDLSKKTQSSGYNVVAGFSKPSEVTMSYDGLTTTAVAAGGSADGHAQIMLKRDSPFVGIFCCNNGFRS